ncbi:alpha/beta hydrolase [Nocardioides mesophilus]|uniref:Alpha/beta hydrolase n=1 Tax=Nocardioides mesophilus TaxID=433659 RepID=A0A7G9RCT4_9ACTN|nr:alpha/beta hydrolase [Nocardioides mesophilus]QNN53409.1 alpha/beta hydrolase [Nocardioides mesophilus]
MLHPQAEQAIALWSAGPSCADPGFGPADVAEVRRAALAEAGREPMEPVDRVEDVDAGGVRCRLHVPAGADGTLVFLHGGGFVFGEVGTHDAQSRRLANRTGRAVLTVDYRRPPEHPFPAAPDDVDAALAWLRDAGAAAGLPTARLAVLGDSAGGNLALVAALRHPGAFDAAVLVYPFLDPEQQAASYDEQDNEALSAAEARWYWQQYAATPDDLRHPDLAPLRASSFAGLPPTLVQVAEHDVLVGEDLELARRIAADGGTVRTTTYPGMIHGFWRHPQLFDAAEQALAEAADFLRGV